MILHDTFAPNGKKDKQVKLSWMLRYPNNGLITKLFVSVPHAPNDKHYDAFVYGTLADGRSINFMFASKSVLENFLFNQHRRVLDGVVVDWFGTIRTINA